MAGYATNGIPVLVGWQFLSGKADTLKDAYAITDYAGFADHSACAVVDREIMSDLGPRMNVDTCL